MSTDDEDFEAFWDALSNENLTEAQYLNRILGPRYLPIKMVIPLTLAYVTIFVTGVIGNVITCTVIVKNTAMHTPTNYYLFNLAISDLILLVLGLPNEVSIFWQQYPWALGLGLCKIRAYVSEMSSYVSVLTIVAFSMERYLAICHPLRLYAKSAMKRPIRFIIAVWLIALFSAIPFAVYTKVNYVEYPPDSGQESLDSAICAMLLPEMPKFPLHALSSFAFFLVPMLVILVFYTRMGLKIRESVKATTFNGNTQASVHWESKQVQGRKSIVKMLSAVVIMFFICWAPFHAQRLLYVYAQEADYYPDLNEWLYILSGFLYYLSTTINPILYNLMSARYREAFKKTVCCRVISKSLRIQPHRKAPQKEMNLPGCDIESEAKLSNTHNSIRYTIDQAKEIFRIGSNHQASPKNGKNLNGPSNHDENCPVQPLLSAKHPIAGQQPSNESSTSRSGFHETLSTASSLL